MSADGSIRKLGCQGVDASEFVQPWFKSAGNRGASTRRRVVIALVLITALHLALAWTVLGRASADAVTPPTPVPMVMAQLMPQQAPRAAPPPESILPPAVEKPVQVQRPPRKTTQPVVKSVPNTTDSPKALSEPRPAETPQAASLPGDEPPSTPAAPSTPGAPTAQAEQLNAPVVPPRFNAAYLNNPPPVYPPILRRNGEEGRVVLRVLVTPDGSAADVRVLAPSTSPLFDEAAMAAVRKWRFVPARRGDVPVPEWVQVPIDFKLG